MSTGQSQRWTVGTGEGGGWQAGRNEQSSHGPFNYFVYVRALKVGQAAACEGNTAAGCERWRGDLFISAIKAVFSNSPNSLVRANAYRLYFKAPFFRSLIQSSPPPDPQRSVSIAEPAQPWLLSSPSIFRQQMAPESSGVQSIFKSLNCSNYAALSLGWDRWFRSENLKSFIIHWSEPTLRTWQLHRQGYLWRQSRVLTARNLTILKCLKQAWEIPNNDFGVWISWQSGWVWWTI